MVMGVLGVVFTALGAVGCGEGARATTNESSNPSEPCDAGDPGYVLPANTDAFQVVEHRAEGGAFVMLNLYRLREFADYSGSPELKPESPVSGADAFERLAALLDAEVESVGGEIIFRAEGGAAFIGPPCERWDVVQLVRYPSYAAFARFAAMDTVIDSIPHRIAVLEDSRIVPLAPES